MKKISSILLVLSCTFLAVIYLFPIWYIGLEAPQYPGGLDMYIWINQITGTDEFTLQNINILNHYIGMEAIHPDSFIELKVMPYVVAFLIVSGLIVSFTKNKKLLTVWTSLLIMAGTVGLLDFYTWQQAFGNNLDPNAPIKIEGMAYSPPFLGVKTILNITASSFPHAGGLAFGASLVFALLATYLSFKQSEKIQLQAI